MVNSNTTLGRLIVGQWFIIVILVLNNTRLPMSTSSYFDCNMDLKDVLPQASSNALRRVSSSTGDGNSNSNNDIGLIGPLKLKTVAYIKENAKVPCNYVHDGFYLQESNEMLHQVYQTVFEDLDDDQIPVVVEVGGHDGITKSLSLKSSVCLGVNTILIEASPKNFGILSKSRPYDRTINAALCEVDSVEIQDNEFNSGQTSVKEVVNEGGVSKEGGVQIPCTSIDKELNTLQNLLPPQYHDKLVLAFLVLDIEGHESIAMRGIQEHSPRKMTMEVNKFSEDEKEQLTGFQKQHNLQGQSCYFADMCYNFQKMGIEGYSPRVFYSARAKVPLNTPATAKVAPAYMFYGQE